MKCLLLIFSLLFAVKGFANTDIDENSSISNAIDKNFSNQWGLDAINIPKLLTNHNADSLGLIAPEKLNKPTSTLPETNQNQWSAADNYIFSSTQVIQEDEKMTNVNVAFIHGRFSAETGLMTNSNHLLSNNEYYVQGAYSLYENQDLNISFTAKIESVNEDTINHYYGVENQIINPSLTLESKTTNTTLGLVSTYSITKKWKILGLISSTNLDKNIENSPLIEHNNVHMALLGTSYSF